MNALIRILGLLLAVIALGVTLTAQERGPDGVTVTCADETRIDNGVAFVLFDLQPDFTYTATVLGLEGFDPVLALIDENDDDPPQCNDDARAARDFEADLPSTGTVEGSSRTAQLRFTVDEAMRDISLVVGGFNGQAGDFVLLVEGLAATDNDDPGDVFAVELSPEMIANNQTITTYMIGVSSSLDPAFYQADDDDLEPLELEDGPVACDDAGNDLRCYGEHDSLAGSSVSRTFGRTARADRFDAMLELEAGLFEDPIDTLTFVLGRASRSGGEYILAVHTATGEADTPATVEAAQVRPTPIPTTPPDTDETTQSENAAPPDDTGERDVETGGVQVACTDGTRFDNGVAFVINEMRPGFTYTATVVGIRGFDPVLAIIYDDDDDEAICNDDSDDAADYRVNLPSTGRVNATSRSAQVSFRQNSDEPADVTLVVGGFNNQSGQFALILEGMATTNEDDPGDLFSMQVTPDLLNMDRPLHVYMLGVDGGVDPLMYLADDDLEISDDASGDPITCDDAGNSLRCWGEPDTLRDSVVSRTRGREVIGEGRDAALRIPASAFDRLAIDNGEPYLRFVMSRYQGSITGDYLVVFHIATGRG